jgi:hypothetical protein
MTDMTEHDPDAFVVIHRNTDGVTVYGVGPFPPDERLAEAVVAKGACDCRKDILWIRFPAGIKMLVGIDLSEIIEEVHAAVDALVDQTDRDRMN